METIYYIDPIFEEEYSKIPEESRRMSSLSFAIAAHLNDILERRGWSKTDFAAAMGKKNAEISKWMSGQHNFTIATIAKIEAVLGEDIISVKKYRNRTVTGSAQMPAEKRQWLSERERPMYGRKKK
jgi:transcriptional regulator with XRE-family HTH domain